MEKEEVIEKADKEFDIKTLNIYTHVHKKGIQFLKRTNQFVRATTYESRGGHVSSRLQPDDQPRNHN